MDRKYLHRYGKIALGVLGIIGVTALVLFLMGRIPYCECGYVKLWHGVVKSSENSQHLADFYTFSHIVHGFLFFGLLSFLKKHLTVKQRLLIALIIECL